MNDRRLLRILFYGICLFVVAAEAANIAGAGDDAEKLVNDAWQAWSNGEVERAEELATRLLDEESFSDEGRHILLLTTCVEGRYEEALKHFAAINNGYNRYDELKQPVFDMHLHLKRYADAEQFALKEKMPAWIVEIVAERKNHPLKVHLDDLSVIPFAKVFLSDYFPGFEAELEGKKVTVHIDTGGAFLHMGTDRAKQMGIELTEGGIGYHGVKRVKTFHGKVRSFRLGDALLENVPVTALPSLKGPQDFVIFGTNVLQQFLSTLDYPNRRLILSPRNHPESKERHLAMLPANRVRIPFYMWGDHYMFARGSVGENKNQNFFVDSGLVSLHPDGKGGIRQAAFTTSKAQLLKWGFRQEDVNRKTFESNLSLGLGSLKQRNLLFLPGEVGSTQFGGVRINGLISHAFLKSYVWSLDFDKREYIFSQ